jgi:TusA-related sulfurtransferase
MKIVDTIGNPCPAPLIATRKALREARSGEAFEVRTDNPDAFRNISRFLDDNRVRYTSGGEEGIWVLTITKG